MFLKLANFGGKNTQGPKQESHNRLWSPLPEGKEPNNYNI
jgi:hypothetical protein